MKFVTLITGSHAYGEVTDNSDVDIVIRCGDKVRKLLKDNADQSSDGSIRFGKLNIICCLDDTSYEVWDAGTKKLIEISNNQDRPIYRDEAKELFDKLRQENGCYDDYR
jgi:predicted nucleotidyltransferase